MGRSFPRRAALAFPIIGRRLSLIWISMLRKLRPFLILFFSFGDKLRDARVDAYVDNQALVRAWQSQAARSSSFSDALKELSNRKGKTTVHKSACQFFGRKGSFSCLCPTRLAYETVDSLIGKLRALFNESGRRGEWDPGFSSVTQPPIFL